MTALTVREVLDSTPEAAAHLETVTVEVARRVGSRGVSLDHISPATHEATTTAVHGTRYRPEKKVFVAISITQDRRKITIPDEGDCFDAKVLPDRSFLSDYLAISAALSIFRGPSRTNTSCNPAMQAAPTSCWSSIFANQVANLSARKS
jgi:hypothetical protein